MSHLPRCRKHDHQQDILLSSCRPALALLALFLTIFFFPAQAQANPRYASIIIDADSGMVLHQRYADKSLHPASLAKLMTLALTFDALKNGTLRLRDRVPMSRHAASMVPSKLGIPAGSSIRVEDAIYALVTKSANDVAAALAEKIGGTEARFAALMTQKARRIGMHHTTYRNASGLHHPAQRSTARDQAKLAQYIIKNYPEYYHYFSTREFSYDGVTYRNHNRLMDKYKGMDGLKTGYINASGFNLIATAKREQGRIIGVVFGGRTTTSRNNHMARLLDNGFGRMNEILLASKIPLPDHKPDLAAVQLASLNPSAHNSQKETALRWAELNPIMQSKAFSALIGQGDYDPSVTQRLETGLIAIDAHKNAVNTTDSRSDQNRPHKVRSRILPEAPQWAIQVGAFTSRIKTDSIVKQALQILPADLNQARPVIVPLRTQEGWLFRGRLSGYNKADAERACRHLPDCLTVAP